MRVDAKTVEQIEQTYRRLAVCRYRPEAPSDGLGNITVSEDELDLDAEATAFAHRWWSDEEGGRSDRGQFWIGVPSWQARPAMIFAIEIARLCCGGGATKDGHPAASIAAELVAELGKPR